MAKVEFLNPFNKGVSYMTFLSAVKESKKTVAEYCKGNLDNEQIEWLENEIKQLKQK